MITRRLHIDIETYSSIDLRSAGVFRYVEAPDFEILLFAFAWEGGDERVVDLAQGEPIPRDVVTALADPGVSKVAHNAAFEMICLGKFYDVNRSSWECTMVHALYCRLPGGLEALCSALGMDSDRAKMRVGRSLISFFCVPCKPTKSNGYRTRNLPEHDPDKWDLFKEYNRQDVRAEMEVDRLLAAWPVPDKELANWRVDQTINRRGVKVDPVLVSQALRIDADMRAKLAAEFEELTDLENPNALGQLKEWISDEVGEEVESLTKADVSELMETTECQTVQRVLEIRQRLGKTSIKKYDAIEACMGRDQRVRGLTQFYGTGTGRWAGRLVQLQNLPRNNIETLSLARDLLRAGRADALKLIYGDVADVLSQLIRTAFVASNGNRLIISDFAAIEARVIAWLAKETWRQDVFATTGKIYETSASKMFGVPVERIVRGNPEYELRQKGKVAELALGYQGGVGALIQMGALDMGLSEEELPDIVRRWRASSPRIRDLWYAVDAAAIEAVRTGQPQFSHGLSFFVTGYLDQYFLQIRLPSGRCLFFNRPFLATGQYGDQLYFYSNNQTSKRWEKTPTYGGKLVENIVQAIARDCLAESIVALEAAGYPIVFHVHDEVVIDTDRGSLQEVVDIMGRPLPWAPGLILKAAGFESAYYMKD